MENSTLDLNTTNSELQLDENGVKYLKEGRGWAMFLAILGFIGMGFMVIAALVMFVAGSFVGSQTGMPVGLFGFLYLVIAGIYIIPILFLFKFSQKASVACNENSGSALNEAIKNLRSHFKSAGIAVISLIGIYFIVIIVVISSGVGNML